MSEELTDEQIDIFVKNEKERLDTIFKAEALGVTISEKALSTSVSIIKQLREEIKMLRKAVDTGIEVEDDLQAKIKRLEGALQKIATRSMSMYLSSGKMLDDFIDTARKALNTK